MVLIESETKRGEIFTKKVKIPESKEVKFNIIYGEDLNGRIEGHYYINLLGKQGVEVGKEYDVCMLVNRHGLFETYIKIDGDIKYFKPIKPKKGQEFLETIEREKLNSTIEDLKERIQKHRESGKEMTNDMKKLQRKIDTYDANKNTLSKKDVENMSKDIKELTECLN